MTSKRKIAANRRNSRNSRGPASAAGKTIASRNSLRHGLTAVIHRSDEPSAEINRIAKALCGNDEDPTLIKAALKVGEDETALRAVRQQKLAAVDRLRDITAIALAKGDNSLVLGQARFIQFWLVSRELDALVPKLMEKYRDQMRPRQSTETEEPTIGMMPIRLKALLEPEDASTEQEFTANLAKVEFEERDEHEALTEALSDLVKLDRYERQTLSRRMRALHAFMNIIFMRRLNEALVR